MTGRGADEAADGRRQRGERRRRAILQAALAIVGAEGTAAVTHRTVARAAGVPLAATTYYFSSKDDLLEQTLRFAAEQEVAHLERAAAGQGPATTVAQVVGQVCAAYQQYLHGDRVQTLALYEIFLEAARRPALRAVAHDWNQAVAGLIEPSLRDLGVPEPGAAARILVAMVDGFILEDLAARQPRFEQDVLRPAIERVLAALHRG